MSYKKEINYHGKWVSIQINSDADESVFNEIFVEREYQAIEQTIINSKNLILDIGAHTGMFTIYAKILNENIKVICFEPEEKNYAALKKNLKENHIKNVISKNVAVSGKGEEMTFYINKDSHNHSFINQENTISTKKIPTSSLEKIFAQQNIIQCDLIKMDCEGAEYEIFKNTPLEVLKKVKNFYIEYHNYEENFNEKILKEILEKAGFKVKLKPSFYSKKMGIIFATK